MNHETHEILRFSHQRKPHLTKRSFLSGCTGHLGELGHELPALGDSNCVSNLSTKEQRFHEISQSNKGNRANRD